MSEEDYERLERVTMRLFLIIILIFVTMALFKSCSLAFVKGDGQGHTIYQADAADVEDVEVDLALRKKVDSHEAKLKKHDEAIVKQEETQEKLIDTLKQILPIPLDTIK